ncbi:hypothetical protein L4C54_04095 [Vibrio lamellibrachiae]|uniref:hypothetical protein n=1 Tax=Vibrio lamellibrachiae TaxID=2910253 RepID=UPI003D15067A
MSALLGGDIVITYHLERTKLGGYIFLNRNCSNQLHIDLNLPSTISKSVNCAEGTA